MADREFYPGLIVTKAVHEQSLHLDFERFPKDRKYMSWIAHCPLCREGMYLNILVVRRRGEKPSHVVPCRVKIPLGCILLLRADVIHSGCYGSPGSYRLHMVFKKSSLSGAQLWYPEKDDDQIPTPLQCGENVNAPDDESSLKMVPRQVTTEEVSHDTGLIK